MTVDERLKELIIEKYGTMKEFTDHIGIPNSTFANILRRGVQNANVVTIIKICQALNISTDALAEGKIIPIKTKEGDVTRIEDIIRNTEQLLLNTECLTFEGKPATKEDVYLILSTLETALDIRKRQQERMAAYYNQILKRNDDK